jgi:hypothetical protein
MFLRMKFNFLGSGHLTLFFFLLTFFSSLQNILQSLNGVYCFSQRTVISSVHSNNVNQVTTPYGVPTFNLVSFCNGTGNPWTGFYKSSLASIDCTASSGEDFNCSSETFGQREIRRQKISCACTGPERGYINFLISSDSVVQVYSPEGNGPGYTCDASVETGSCVLNERFYYIYSMVTLFSFASIMFLSIFTYNNTGFLFKKLEGGSLDLFLSKYSSHLMNYGFLRYCNWIKCGRSYCNKAYTFVDREVKLTEAPFLHHLEDSIDTLEGFYRVQALSCNKYVIDFNYKDFNYKNYENLCETSASLLRFCFKEIFKGKKICEGSHFLSIEDIISNCKMKRSLEEIDLNSYVYGKLNPMEVFVEHNKTFFGSKMVVALERVFNRCHINPCTSLIRNTEWKIYCSDVMHHLGLSPKSKVKKFGESSSLKSVLLKHEITSLDFRSILEKGFKVDYDLVMEEKDYSSLFKSIISGNRAAKEKVLVNNCSKTGIGSEKGRKDEEAEKIEREVIKMQERIKSRSYEKINESLSKGSDEISQTLLPKTNNFIYSIPHIHPTGPGSGKTYSQCCNIGMKSADFDDYIEARDRVFKIQSSLKELEEVKSTIKEILEKRKEIKADSSLGPEESGKRGDREIVFYSNEGFRFVKKIKETVKKVEKVKRNPDLIRQIGSFTSKICDSSLEKNRYYLDPETTRRIYFSTKLLDSPDAVSNLFYLKKEKKIDIGKMDKVWDEFDRNICDSPDDFRKSISNAKPSSSKSKNKNKKKKRVKFFKLNDKRNKNSLSKWLKTEKNSNGFNSFYGSKEVRSAVKKDLMEKVEEGKLRSCRNMLYKDGVSYKDIGVKNSFMRAIIKRSEIKVEGGCTKDDCVHLRQAISSIKVIVKWMDENKELLTPFLVGKEKEFFIPSTKEVIENEMRKHGVVIKADLLSLYLRGLLKNKN